MEQTDEQGVCFPLTESPTEVRCTVAYDGTTEGELVKLARTIVFG